jgi:hypothetical protein
MYTGIARICLFYRGEKAEKLVATKKFVLCLLIFDSVMLGLMADY